MSDESPSSFDIEHRPLGNPTPVGIPALEEAATDEAKAPPAPGLRRRASTSRHDGTAPVRRSGRPARDSDAPARLPALFRPGFLLLLASMLAAVWWLGFTNPVKGVIGEPACWPWELFRSHLAAGGEAFFAWDFARSIAVAGVFFILFWLLLGILRASRRRGGAGLIGVGLGAAAFQSWDRDVLALAVSVTAAAVAGATLARYDGTGRRARGVLVVALLLLAGTLFFPLPVAAGAGWIPQARGLSMPFGDLIRGDLPFAGPDRLVTTDALHALLLLLLLIVGVLAVFGARRRRLFTRLATILVIAVVVVPPVAARLFGLADGRTATPDLLAVLNDPGWLGLFCAGLLLLAGLASGLGLGRRGAAWLAGITLFLLVFDVGSTTFREGTKAVLSTQPDSDGLIYLSRFLAISLGAFLLPLAAGILDTTRHREGNGEDR
ncbi:MAG: hypothetical protein ACC662_05255 [Planctomycetota bacterium]